MSHPLPLDFTGVAEKLSALPPGNFPAIIENVEEKTSSTGNPMLLFTFRITAGPHAERKVFQNYSLTPEALWKLYQTLRNLGFTEEELAGQFELDPNELINLECTLVLKPSEYQGRVTHKVATVLPAGAETGTTIAAEASDIPF